MLCDFMKICKRLLFALMLGCLMPMALAAQAIFTIPNNLDTAYSNYDRIETCMVMANRVASQLASKWDSLEFKERIFQKMRIDTTKKITRRSVAQCMKKFRLESLAEHDSISRGKDSILPIAMSLYYVGEDYDKFYRLVDSLMIGQKIKDTDYKAYLSAFSIIQSAVFSVQPFNYDIIDSLQDKYILPILLKNQGDLKAYLNYATILLARIDRVYGDSLGKGKTEYEGLVSRIKNDLGERLEVGNSKEAMEIRGLIRGIYDKINYVATLDSLRISGPDGYFNSLRANHKLAGFKDERTFGGGQTKKMFVPAAFKAFRYGKDVWASENGENEEYDFAKTGVPYVVMSFNALCRNEIFHRAREIWQRGETSFECWSQYEVIKWLKKTYPDIRMVIITHTHGHITELAIRDSNEEAELIRQAWWDFHKLPADIVVYETGYFNMPDVDRRREDFDNDNISKYRELISDKRASRIYPTLVGPDGRILTVLNFGEGATQKISEILNPFMIWYRNHRGPDQL